MAKSIDARDVLVCNARSARQWSGRVVARFRRTGPNAWDSFVREPIEDGETIEVLPAVKLQIEPSGALARLRRRGEVVVVAWQPEAADAAAIAAGGSAAAVFRDRCVRGYSEARGMGPAMAIARCLGKRGPDGPPGG